MNAAVPTIRKVDASGDCLVRDHWIIAFFCQVPFPQMVEGCRKAFELWKQLVPADAIKYCMIGPTASKPKKVGPKSVAQCLDQLDPDAAAVRELSSFEIGGPQAYNADFWFQMIGNLDLRLAGKVAKSNLVEARLSTEFVNEHGIETIVQLATAWAEVLPYSSGYASPAVSFIAESLLDKAGKVIGPAALQYQGLDVHFNQNTRFFIRGRVVGARWLTFLGPELVNHFGGNDALAKRLPGITVVEAGAGVLCRAGAVPEIGDTNKQQPTPLLRQLAKVLEPVTYFGNTHLEGLLGNEDRLDAWERRFLD